MELIRLKVNSQYRPCVDEAPYFSWVITSDEKNVMQTSYHITVKNMDEVMWDSGMVESDKSIFVEYSGKPLQSLSDYNWTVEVTVNNGGMFISCISFNRKVQYSFRLLLVVNKIWQRYFNTTDRKLSCVAVTLKLSMISRVSDFRERRKRLCL